MAYAYVYEIKSINISEGTMLVKYTPDDTKLTATNLVIYGYRKDDLGNEMTIIDVIKAASPQDLWKTQDAMITNFDTLNNRIESVPTE